MSTNHEDPRDTLVRAKYFSVRPKPLEQWLWQQGVPPAAERVFWLHWEEGHKNRTWCSQVPIRRVASACYLDVSTVTRAYQLLAKLGVLRRQDPGRNPNNPFCQATAVTEVRVPRELVTELDRHPNRHVKLQHRPVERAPAAPAAPPPATSAVESPASPSVPQARPEDPFKGLRGWKRVTALTQLTGRLTPQEARRFDEACRAGAQAIAFDADSPTAVADREMVLQWLACIAVKETPSAPRPAAISQEPTFAPRRTLTPLELARARREITRCVASEHAAETLRQVVWSIEEGALRRFTPVHALNIAVKKIREGAWSRPNRMPPNWCLPLSRLALTESCRAA